MKLAKILEIGPYPPPHTGWSVRLALVKRELAKLGHECAVINLGKNRTVKSPEYEDVQNGWDYIGKVFCYCYRGYLVHMHMNGHSRKIFVLVLIAQFISMLFLRSIVVTLHGGLPQTYFPKKQNRWCIPLFWLIFTLSKKIICNDDKIKQHICAYGISPRKVFSIPAFTKQYLQFAAQPCEDKLENFLHAHTPILSSYALRRSLFHMDTTIRALKILKQRWPKIGMVFIGDLEKQEEIELGDLEALIGQLELQQNIYWSGNLTHDEFLTSIQRSQLVIRSYEADGVCSSVLEALALGIPVVACENELRPPEVVTFKTADEQDLAMKVEYVFDNYQQIKKQMEKSASSDTLSREIDLLTGL